MLRKTREKYEEHFLRNDLIVLVILYICALCFLYFKKKSLFDLVKDVDSFYSSILTISSGLVLFLITSVTILISFLDNKNLSVLKNTAHPNNMLKTFFSGIGIASLVVALSVATEFSLPYEKFVFYIVSFFFLLMLVRFLRIIWILYNLSYILIIADD